MKRILTIAAAAFFLSVMPASAQSLAEISTVSPVSLAIGANIDGSRSLVLGFSGAKAGNFEQVIDPGKSGRKCVEYFFTCLSLPDERFWVNLNPAEPSSVIDNEFSRTDFGKVLLTADLRLKKDTSELTNPRSATGREYWDRLYRKAEELGVADRVPSSSRVWIVPGEVTVNESSDRITIVRSELNVMMQSNDAPAAPDPRMTELQEYAGQLMRELIIPVLQEKVNGHYAYWELRQLFRVMVLARWYKQAALRGELPRENLAALESENSYCADDIYSDYLDSLKRGEYSVTETNQNKINLFLQLITRTYVSGGIDFRKKITCRHEPSAVVQNEGTVQFSCRFDNGENLQAAKRSLRVELFPGIGTGMRITPDLFKSLPPPIRFGKQVEERISGKVFLSNL
jgi:hypothetical protein